LTTVWGDIDLASSCMLIGDRHEVAGLERTLHFLLERWRIEKQRNFDGKTEWFSMDCFDNAMEIIVSAAMLRNFNLEDRLIYGLNNIVNQKRIRGTKIKRTSKVIAELDDIMTHWPIYKNGTINLIDHPSVQNNWLWTVDIGNSSVRFFMDLFRFQNDCSSIRLIQEAYTYKDRLPSIVDASISKLAFSWLQRFQFLTVTLQ
jgi:hypothetical protein